MAFKISCNCWSQNTVQFTYPLKVFSLSEKKDIM